MLLEKSVQLFASVYFNRVITGGERLTPVPKRANRVDARFVDHKAKRVLAVKTSCPWLDNRAKKNTEKTEKYEPLRWEFTRRYPGYKIVQT